MVVDTIQSCVSRSGNLKTEKTEENTVRNETISDSTLLKNGRVVFVSSIFLFGVFSSSLSVKKTSRQKSTNADTRTQLQSLVFILLCCISSAGIYEERSEKKEAEQNNAKVTKMNSLG